MSASDESQLPLKSQPVDNDNDELFVKLPKFTKQVVGKKPEKDCVQKQLVTCATANERLYKFVKQPLNQRWIWCEFVESFIDQSVLSGGYDMKWYLDNIYPQLQCNNNKMPLRCWQIVRRSMGTPRRFSPAFIESQMQFLNQDREVVRSLQKGKFDMESFGMPMEVMPKLIPMQLPMDTKVISLLRSPNIKEMLYKGRVMSYDPNNSTYLIKFDIGNNKHITLTMADHLLHSVNNCKSKAIADIIQDDKDKENDKDKAVAKPTTTVLGNVPMPLVNALMNLNKQIAVKKTTVQDMALMNQEMDQASGAVAGAVALSNTQSKRRELKPTQQQRDKMQRRYASNMMTLHSVNAEILDSAKVAHSHLDELEQDELKNKSNMTKSNIYDKCRSLAENDLKNSPGLPNIKSQGTRDLILQMQTILYLAGERGQGNDTNVNAVLNEFVSSITPTIAPQLHPDFNKVLQLLQSIQEQSIQEPKGAQITQSESEQLDTNPTEN